MADIFSQPIDKGALTLARSIALQESGKDGKPNYNAIGDAGTSKGGYQWQPGNYEAGAKAAGLDPTDFSPTNQDKVAYSQVMEMKKEGMTPDQIAAAWNSGRGKALSGAWKTNVGTTTINNQKIAYDTPKYVRGVNAHYQQLMGSQGQSGASQGYQTTASLPEATGKPVEKGFLGSVASDVTGALGGAGDAVSRTMQGKINPLSGLLQGAGALAGGIGGVTNDVLGLIPGVKQGEELLGKGVQAVAGTQLGQQAIGAYQGLPEEWKANIGAAGNIATAIPLLKGLGIAKNAAGAGIKGVLGGTTDAVAEMVAPKLTAKATAEAIAQRGTSQKGILRRTVLNQDPQVAKLGEAVKANVPQFDTSKGLLHNINATKTAATQMAKDLKAKVISSGSDRIYSYRELGSKLGAIEKPVLVSSDATLNNAYNNVIKKALEIAKSKGGKVSNLLDVRQELDYWLERQFPNLYTSDTLTPLRQAVKDVRQTITDFTAENLPAEVGLKDSLLTQHKLLTAVENMAGKASSGAEKEIGSTVVSRFGKRHPLIRSGARIVGRGLIEGTGAGAALRGMGAL